MDPSGHGHAASPGPLADASVRVGRVTDAPAVGLVQAAVMREAYAAHLAAEVIEQFQPGPLAAVWRRSLDAPPSGAHRLLVACAGEQVVGFAAVGPAADPDAREGTSELLVLGVHPDARRQGHGSRLVNAVVDTARAGGGEELTAWVLEEDPVTAAFLERAGLGRDGATRDRVVSADGATLREVRLSAIIVSE